MTVAVLNSAGQVINILRGGEWLIRGYTTEYVELAEGYGIGDYYDHSIQTWRKG